MLQNVKLCLKTAPWRPYCKMTDIKKFKNFKNCACPSYWKMSAFQDGCRISVKLSKDMKTKGLGATLSRTKVICLIIRSITYLLR